MTNFKSVTLDMDLSFEIMRSLRAMGTVDHHEMADKIGMAIRDSIGNGMTAIADKYKPAIQSSVTLDLGNPCVIVTPESK